MTPRAHQRLQSLLGVDILRVQPVSGGCIAQASRVDTSQGPVFVKSGSGVVAKALLAEAHGLRILARSSGDLLIPEVLHLDEGAETLLVLTWLNSAPPGDGFFGRFGSALAHLHRQTQPRFGLEQDNFIGSSVQSNGWASSWPVFFRDNRLRVQVELARRNLRWRPDWDPLWQSVEARTEVLLPDLPSGSLLHGDLWSGNFMATPDGRAALFDPAVYWGDPWADIAMTRLFGGFPEEFYRAYRARQDRIPGDLATRCRAYNLYHELNHLNLFGEGYAKAVRDSLRALAGP